jgi:nicotinate-nucleotide adenylyltransferase
VSTGVAPIRKVAIYGGAFDPIHNGHLATIAQLLASRQVDSIVVVPSGDRPDKTARVSAADRLSMVRLAVSEAFAGDPRVEVSDLHVAGKVGYGTIDLVDYFTKTPGIDPYVVIGRELIADLPQWKESARLCSHARFIVIDRPGVSPGPLPQGVQGASLQAPYQAGVFVSSTLVRSLLSQGLSCAGLVPQCVIAFCTARGLYDPKP